MECPRCGLSNTEAARFCPGCGNALSGAPSLLYTERPPVVSNTLASNERSDVVPPVPRPAANAAPEVFELVQRPEPMRSSTPDMTFPSRSHRPAVVGAALAHLAVISQDGSTGQTYWIERGSVDIGREEGDIRLATDRFVSPRHARVYSRGSTFYLRDLGSLNGVFLRVRETEALKDADQILLGSEVLRFGLLTDSEQGLGAANERGTDVYGSPARPRYACLCERTVEGVYRNVFYISTDETVVGREFGDLVFTADSFMSRRHAAIHRDPTAGTFTLRDLGSSNGTYLAIRGEVELREGDHLRVGQHLFRFGFGS
jgi:pSer/pThr/pTyr-binding forkhead associated (FHA) protein